MASAYTPEQIAQYEQYIDLPVQYRKAAKPELDIKYLNSLHVHQISAVPYENLSLHYSTEHRVELDVQFLFKKIVGEARGRGGYCMENSIFFNHVLRALGFKAYMAGVRVRPRIGGVPGGDYIGWVHVVNIVTLPDGSKYMLDVGFGGDQATKPVPLIHGHTIKNLGSQEIRLIFDTIPQQVDQTKKLWIYQYRNSTESQWNSFYCFPEFEFLAEDFEIINFFTSKSFRENNFQVRTVIGVRFLRGGDEEGDTEIVGKLMLVNGEVKRNDGGKTKVEFVCRTEEERVLALKERFGIHLNEEEIQGVKGRIVELAAA